MAIIESRQQVIITNVSPQIQEGAYPAKTGIQEETAISADVFTHGHEALEAVVLLKHRSEKNWSQFSMRFVSNDRWEFIFAPDKTGIYLFKIRAWVNHFATWQKGLVKKYKASQDLSTELQIGAGLIEAAVSTSKSKDKSTLQKFSSALASEENFEKALAIATDERLTGLMACCHNAALCAAYPKTLLIEAERKKAVFSTWYELFPRSASSEPGRHGTFNDVKKLLPRLAAMGFDTLYLPPIHPIGEEKRKGKNNALEAGKNDPGSPWAIGNKLGGHMSIHPQLGSMKDFQALIKAAKQAGIELAMDIAFQCAPDHPYVKQHPRWFKWRPDGTVQYAENPPKRYEDILPFDFETDEQEALWQELKRILEFWIAKGIRIFRIDNPHTKSFAFWRWVIAEIRTDYPEVIFLAEAFTRPRIMEQLAMAGFNQSYTYFTWRHTKKELETYVKELTTTGLKNYFRPNFWPNTPDILPPELIAGGENMHILRLILAATLSSNYGIYGPLYEFGITQAMPGKEEYLDSEKYEIRHWDWQAETRIGEVITLVNSIRKQNAALHSTWNIEFMETTSDQILCYTKIDRKNDNMLIVAVNLDPHNVQAAYVNIPAEKLDMAAGQEYRVHDLLSQEKYRWRDGLNYVQLNPFEMPAHILKIETTPY